MDNMCLHEAKTLKDKIHGIIAYKIFEPANKDLLAGYLYGNNGIIGLIRYSPEFLYKIGGTYDAREVPIVSGSKEFYVSGFHAYVIPFPHPYLYKVKLDYVHTIGTQDDQVVVVGRIMTILEKVE